MATYQKFQSFVEAVTEEKHNFSADTLELALCAAANPPTGTYSVLGDLTQINYANLSARTLTTSSHAQVGGTYSLVVADKVLTATGTVAAFQYVVVFNQSAPSDELICWYDYGSPVTLNNGETFTVDFGSSLFTLT